MSSARPGEPVSEEREQEQAKRRAGRRSIMLIAAVFYLILGVLVVGGIAIAFAVAS